MITREELEELLAAWDAFQEGLTSNEGASAEVTGRLEAIIEGFRPLLDSVVGVRRGDEPDPETITVDPRAGGHVARAPEQPDGWAKPAEVSEEAWSRLAPPPGQAAIEVALRGLYAAAVTLLAQGPSASGWEDLQAAVDRARSFVR
jgi:hypothetical protein